MKKLSTRCMNNIENKRRCNSQRNEAAPSKQTLDFLTQFARVYQVEPILREDICAYVLN